MKQSNPKGYLQAALLAGIPLMLLSGPVCGYFVGHFLDQRLNTDPVLMVLFTILGGIAGVGEMLKLIKRLPNNG